VQLREFCEQCEFCIFKLRWEEGKNSDLAVKETRKEREGGMGEKNMERLMEKMC